MSTLIETIATHQRAHSADNAAIRPFRVSVPEAELTDLRQCLAMDKVSGSIEPTDAPARC
jgi:hypothetical protein